MNPRLKSSRKWTSFPKEYSNQIQSVFKENFSQYLDKGEIIIEGRIYPEEIMLRVGFLETGRLAQANFEVSINFSQTDQEAINAIHNCVDAAASMMLEYLENDGEVDFPYSWKEFPFQGHKVYLQFNTENTNLEAEANRLLGLSTEQLFNDDENPDDEDALIHAEIDETLKSQPEETESEIYDEELIDDEDVGSSKRKIKKLH